MNAGVAGACGLLEGRRATTNFQMLDALANLIVRVSELVSDFPEISEMDLNPVFASETGAIAYKLVDLTIGLRVTEEEEREGLDISSHGETAYHK